MHPLLRMNLAVALLTIPCAGTALADLPVYYHVGSWDAFSGTGDDGKPVCGIGTTNPADGRSFSIRFIIGGEDVSFQAKKPSWTIPDGTQLPLVMQIGLDAPWNQQGTGHGQVVDWTLDRTTIQTFDAQFRRAGSMTLTFPSGNEAPWILSLSGSMAASNAFGRCITDLTRRTGVQSAPAAPAAATQPFVQAPTQSTTQAPTQPTTEAPTQPTTAPVAPK